MSDENSAPSTENETNPAESMGSMLDLVNTESPNNAPSPRPSEQGTPQDPAVVGSLLDRTALPAQVAEQAKSDIEYTPFDFKGQQANEQNLNDYIVAAKKTGLSQEQAQDIITHQLELQQKGMINYKQQINGWEQQILKDPELGGNNLEATLLTANRAVMQYDKTGELAGILKASGYGSHPAVIRFLQNVGKDLAEDSSVTGETRSKVPLEERLWDNWNVKK